MHYWFYNKPITTGRGVCVSLNRAPCTMLLVKVLIVFVKYQFISPLFRITFPGIPPQFLLTSPTTGVTSFNPCSLFWNVFLLRLLDLLSESLSALLVISLGHSTHQGVNNILGESIPVFSDTFAQSFTVTISWFLDYGLFVHVA